MNGAAATVADEFLAASRQAVAGAAGSEALASLGWWDLLDALDDAEARVALYALFRAQGLELADTCALGALVAAPFLAGRGDQGTVVAAFARESVHRGTVHLVVGDPAVDQVLVDLPDGGVALVPVADLTLRPVDVPGRLGLHEVEVDPGLPPTIDAEAAAPARARGVFLGRTAAASEMLGAAEGALALAVEHARGRVQFGQPIGSFQAVRHLLAWAVADCAAVDAVVAAARDLDVDAPDRFDAVTKALAGRNGRRACERALQVLGGIGFTAELDHHHFHSRVLTLDSVLGSSTELTAALGAWIRGQRPDPGIAHAVLFGLDG